MVNFIDGKLEISSQSNICVLPRTHLDPFNKGNAPINVNPLPVRGGGGGGVGSAGKGRGFDAWDYPPVGLFIVRSDPGLGTFDFDR